MLADTVGALAVVSVAAAFACWTATDAGILALAEARHEAQSAPSATG